MDWSKSFALFLALALGLTSFASDSLASSPAADDVEAGSESSAANSANSSDDMSYDSIVDQLSKENSALDASSRAKLKSLPGNDPFDSSVIHG
ncbi:MAG: hypothetical protein EOP05_08645, partial [Proteobacteria bacterium]